MSIGSGGCIEKLRDKIHKQKGQKTKRQATRYHCKRGNDRRKYKKTEVQRKEKEAQKETNRMQEKCREIKWERKRFDGTKKLG